MQGIFSIKEKFEEQGVVYIGKYSYSPFGRSDSSTTDSFDSALSAAVFWARVGIVSGRFRPAHVEQKPSHKAPKPCPKRRGLN